MYSLQDVLKEFLFEIQIKNYTARTNKCYKNNNNLFITFLSKEFSIHNVSEVTHLHLRQYIKFLTQQGRKATYINSILKNIRAYFEYCVQEEYLSNNPAKQVKWQKEEKTIILTFSNDEVVKMLDVYNRKT